LTIRCDVPRRAATGTARDGHRDREFTTRSIDLDSSAREDDASASSSVVGARATASGVVAGREGVHA